jgi:tetratricopeptide (TPR) repeat protein
MLFLLAALLLTQPDETERLLIRAIELHQSGDVEAAVPEYQAYLAVRPQNFLARSNLGAAFARLGRFENAIEQYREALEIDPRNQAVRLNLGLAHYKFAQLEDAIRELRTVVAAQPENKSALLLLADCHLRRDENKLVVELLAPRESLFRNDLAYDYLLGMALILEKQVERGQVLIDRILRNGDSAEAQLLLGVAVQQGGDYSVAVKHFARAVELNPNLPTVRSMYGLALLQTGNPEAATAEFRGELVANPNDFQANLNLGALLRQDREFEEALRCFERALRLRPRFPAARYQIGALYLDTGRVEEARQVLEPLVRDAPNFLEAHVSLASVYYRLKRKADGDRHREIVRKLAAERQALQPGAETPDSVEH